MCAQITKETAPLIDPAFAPDIFCEGIAAITKIGPDCLRFTLYANRERGEGDTERLVVAQLIWTKATLELALKQCDMAIKGLPFLSTLGPPRLSN